MSKTKNYYWDSASKFLSQIENELITQKINKSEALEKMQNSNEALYLEGINNSVDAEEWVDSVVAELLNDWGVVSEAAQ